MVVAIVTKLVVMVTIMVAMEMEPVATEFMAITYIKRPKLIIKHYNFTKNITSLFFSNSIHFRPAFVSHFAVRYP